MDRMVRHAVAVPRIHRWLNGIMNLPVDAGWIRISEHSFSSTARRFACLFNAANSGLALSLFSQRCAAEGRLDRGRFGLRLPLAPVDQMPGMMRRKSAKLRLAGSISSDGRCTVDHFASRLTQPTPPG